MNSRNSATRPFASISLGRFVLLLTLALACVSAFAALPDIPANYTHELCLTKKEAARNSPLSIGVDVYDAYSCEQLDLVNDWRPTLHLILDASNAIPMQVGKPSPTTIHKMQDALQTLSASVHWVDAHYKIAEPTASEKTNELFATYLQQNQTLLADYLNKSQARFVAFGLKPPTSLAGIFDDLRARISKPYVSRDELQTVANLASERGGELQRVASQAAANLVDDAGRAQVRAASETAQKIVHGEPLNVQPDNAQSLNAPLIPSPSMGTRFGWWISGLWDSLIGSAILALIGMWFIRHQPMPARNRMIVFAAATAAIFVANLLTLFLLSVVIGRITFTSRVLTFFLLFGIIYVLFRNKLHAHFGGGQASRGTHGSAAWATLADALRAGRIFQRGRVADDWGFALGKMPGAGEELDPRLRYMGHVVTCAPNGSGKGIGAVIPTLLEYPGSALVLDIKGENFAVTARARKAMGHTICLVDPFGFTGDRASRFNPLAALNLSSPDLVGEAAALVEMLVVTSGGQQDDNSAHFNESAKDLLKGLAVYVAANADPSKRTLGELRRLLSLPLAAPQGSDRESLTNHLTDMTDDPAAFFGIPARAANGFLSKDSKEASGVHSTALRHTSFLDDPRIAAALAQSDFSFADLKRTSMTVYVVIPPDKIAAQSRFLRVLVGSALSAVTSTADKPRFNVLFMLDEFAQLGKMEMIENAISLVRGYGARFWIVIQGLDQLKGVYTRWQTFLANSAKQFFGTADYETAKYVSDMLGQETIDFQTVGGSTSSSMQGGSSGSSTSQQVAGRALLTPDEVMRQGPTRPIVHIQGERPYSLVRLNYLADAEYAGLADPNPFHR